MFQIGGVSGIPIDPVIPETGEALQVRVYDGGMGPGTAGLDVIGEPSGVPAGLDVIVAPSGVPAGLDGIGDEGGAAGFTAAWAAAEGAAL
jgi:hypothetical protein